MAGLAMPKCGVCKDTTLHKLNVCIHCGAIYADSVMVLDPEASYRRLLDIESGGLAERNRKRGRGRGIRIRSTREADGDPAI